MILENFKVVGLHGLIDADIHFKKELNVLVGRNGSGKTSILTLISHLLRLDLESVRSTRFASAELQLLDEDGTVYTIAVTNASAEGTISISDSHGASAQKQLIEVPGAFSLSLPKWIAKPGRTVTSASTDSLAVLYERMEQWGRVSADLQKRIRSTFVRLDRTIVAVDPEGTETYDGLRSESGAKGRGRVATIRDPIDQVSSVTQRRFLDYKRSTERNKAEAYRQLLELHFAPIQSATAKTRPGQVEKKLPQLRSRVAASELTADSKDIQVAAGVFFDSFEDLLKQREKNEGTKRVGRRSQAEESVRLMLDMKGRQIEKLLDIFDTEQRLASEARKPIQTYLDALNKFFQDSGKELRFDEGLFELGFVVPASEGSDTTIFRTLKDLSSGERQVLIVLTYLAFLSGTNSIFIIDEPELSLHLRWQGYLMDAMRALRPNGCQIVIATHAPEMAGRARPYCITLSPSYLRTVAGTANE